MRSACWAAKRRPLLRSPEAGSLRASRCARLAGRRSAALYSGRPKRAPCAPRDALGLLGGEAPPFTPVARSGLPARLAMRSACWAAKRRPLLRSPEAGSLRGSRGARLAGRRSAAHYSGRPKRAPCAPRDALGLLGVEAPPITPVARNGLPARLAMRSAREALALLGVEAPPSTSFARYRSLIRGLPPTPAQAHQESLVRAATASLTSFVGSRPHPQKRRRSHSLATARSFVGYRPHPHKRTKNHSFVPVKRHSHRSWATTHTRRSAEEVIRSLPLAHSWATAHTRTSAPRITRSCRYSVPHIVRGLPPTPASAQKKSFARYRSLIRGLPPTPAQAQKKSFARYRSHTYGLQ